MGSKTKLNSLNSMFLQPELGAGCQQYSSFYALGFLCQCYIFFWRWCEHSHRGLLWCFVTLAYGTSLCAGGRVVISFKSSLCFSQHNEWWINQHTRHFMQHFEAPTIVNKCISKISFDATNKPLIREEMQSIISLNVHQICFLIQLACLDLYKINVT